MKQETGEKLTDPELSIPLADSLFKSLSTDLNDNIKAECIVKNTNHSTTLNTKLTRHNTLNKMETDLQEKNETNSLRALMSVFNLESEEDAESRVAKVSALYDLYEINTDHKLEDWCEFKVKIT